MLNHNQAIFCKRIAVHSIKEYIGMFTLHNCVQHLHFVIGAGYTVGKNMGGTNGGYIGSALGAAGGAALGNKISKDKEYDRYQERKWKKKRNRR